MSYNLQDCIRDIGEIPYCQCDSNDGNSCGLKVNINPLRYKFYLRKGYPKYINEHKSLSGSKNGMFGKKHKPETIQKMKDSSPHLSNEDHWNYGNITPEETKEKISISITEFYKNNPKILEHLSDVRTGKNCGNLNSSKRTEVKNKISESLKEFFRLNPDAIKRGKDHPQFGKIGELSQLFGKSTPHRSGRGNGDYHLTPSQGIVWMKSSWEIKYAKYLEQNEINYYYEINAFKMNIGYNTTYRPDFYIPSERTFVEIKGRNNRNSWEDCDGKLKSDEFCKNHCLFWNYKILFGDDLISLGINLKTNIKNNME